MGRRQQQLFVEPSRLFHYLVHASPAVTELLVAPLGHADNMVGAAWVALHDVSRRFDGEDERRLAVLTQCASAAYRVADAYAVSQAAQPIPAMPAVARAHRPLSTREREVCMMVAYGYTNKAIATTLGVTAKSVETYRARVCDKLGFRNRADFVSYALHHGLLTGSRAPV